MWQPEPLSSSGSVLILGPSSLFSYSSSLKEHGILWQDLELEPAKAKDVALWVKWVPWSPSSQFSQFWVITKHHGGEADEGFRQQKMSSGLADLHASFQSLKTHDSISYLGCNQRWLQLKSMGIQSRRKETL